MRLSTRAQPPDDSPIPGVIPGTVHVHNEPDHAERAKREPETARPTCGSLKRLTWRFGRGHRG